MLIAAFALMLWQGKKAQEQAWEKAQEASNNMDMRTHSNENDNGSIISPMGNLSTDNESPLLYSQDSITETFSGSSNMSASNPSDNSRFSYKQQLPEEIYTLENSFISVDFTNRGGAIKEVGLKKYPAIKSALVVVTSVNL